MTWASSGRFQWDTLIIMLGFTLGASLVAHRLGPYAGEVLLGGSLFSLLMFVWPLLRKSHNHAMDASFAAERLAKDALQLVQQGKITQAKMKYERAITVLGSGVSAKQEGTILGFLALLEKDRDEHDLAISHLTRSLELAESIGDVSAQIVRNNNIANILITKQHRHSSALPYLNAAVKLARDNNDTVRLVQALAHRGQSLLECDQLERARADVAEAWQHTGPTQDPLSYGLAVIARCLLWAAEGKKQEALDGILKLVQLPRIPIEIRNYAYSTAQILQEAVICGEPVTIGSCGVTRSRRLRLNHALDPGTAKILERILRRDPDLGGIQRRIQQLEAMLNDEPFRSDIIASCVARLNIGALQHGSGHPNESISTLTQVIADSEGTDEWHVQCIAYMTRASAFHARGLWIEASADYKTAITLAQTHGYPDVEGLAITGNAGIHRDLGDWDMAMKQYDQAETIAKQTNDKSLQGAIYQNRGNLFSRRRRYEEAFVSYNLAYEIGRETNDGTLRRMALNMMGSSRKRQAQVSSASADRSRLLLEAKDLIARSLGSTDATESDYLGIPLRRIALATVLVNLDLLAEAKREFGLALDDLSRQQQVSLDVSMALLHYGALLINLGEVDKGAEFVLGSTRLNNFLLAQSLSLTDERKLLALFARSNASLSTAVSMIAQGGPLSNSCDAVRSCADIVLSRKGAVAETMRGRHELEQQPPDNNTMAILHELAKIHHNLGIQLISEIVQKREDSSKQKEWLTDHRRIMEKLHGKYPTAVRVACLGQVTSQDVAMALPGDTELVEIIRFRSWGFGVPTLLSQWDGDRYGAFIIPGGDGTVQFVDLGDAKKLDVYIEGAINAITHQEVVSANESGPMGELQECLGTPLLNVFRPTTKHLYIAPDSALSLFPFEILNGHTKRYWADEFSIVYLTSGRNLMNSPELHMENGPPIVVGAPDFNLCLNEASSQTRETDDDDLRNSLHDVGIETFYPLPGSEKETDLVAKKLGVEPWNGTLALEESIRLVRCPQVVHIATHGFFLPDSTAKADSPWADSDGDSISMVESNPLMRAGLALAGANSWLNGRSLPKEAGDGILLARDILSMNLHGTDLVVLSACVSATGRISTGDGVFGLRRALAIAGAHNVVMSLWEVPDEVMMQFMEVFYEAYKHDHDTTYAVSEARATIKRSYSHPWNWAGVILQRNVRPLP